MLNTKISEVHANYERVLSDLDSVNKDLHSKIELFKKLEGDNPSGLKFDEMNLDSVIKKLTLIERDP